MKNKTNFFSAVVVAFVIVVILKTFVVGGFIVSGDSMSPIIVSGDYVLLNKLAYINSDPKRGDIIVVRPRIYANQIVKRIVGMPGERLQIANGQIIIRNERTDPGATITEPYLIDQTTQAVGSARIQLDPNEYFVFGDNRGASIDSRELGPVDRSNIKGKVFGIFILKELKYKSL